MGLMDRVKAQATQLAQKTQEAAAEGKARLDQAQANRRGDVLLRNLGAAIYADKTGRAGPNSQANIDKLIAAISEHEKENGLNLSAEQPDANVPQQNFPSGGFAGPSGQADPGAGGTSSFPPGGFTGPSGQADPGAGGTSSFPPGGFTGPSAQADPGSGGSNSFPPEA